MRLAWNRLQVLGVMGPVLPGLVLVLGSWWTALRHHRSSSWALSAAAVGVGLAAFV